MKIDFNGQEMVIKFDKVPNILYFNETGTGVGQLFINGVRRKGLIQVKLDAHTNDDTGIYPMKLDINYCDNHTLINEKNYEDIKISFVMRFKSFLRKRGIIK